MTILLRLLTATIVISTLTPQGALAEPVWTGTVVERCTGITKDTSGVLYAVGIDGVWRSSDNGDNWQLVGVGATFLDGFAIAVNPTTNDIFLAVEAGVFRSHDEGSTWTKLGDEAGGAYALAVRDDGLIVAAGSPGIVKSTDNGVSWVPASTTTGPSHNAIAFSKTGTVFVSSLVNGLLRSTDDGITWQNVSGSFGAANDVQDVVTDQTRGYVYATAFHMFFNEPTYNKVFRSTDDGTTWMQVDSVGGISLSMGVDVFGRVFSGRTPAAYSTDHGANWIDISSGIIQGDRLVEFTAAANGRVFVADMDDSLRFIDLGVSQICGDADGGGTVDVSDVVYLISFIFVGGGAPNPMEAGDANGSGGVDISDAVYLISYIFQGGSAPCST